MTHICNQNDPYKAEQHGPEAIHEDTEYTGERFLRGNRMAMRRCRVCGTRLMTEPTADELAEKGRA
jgi:hypothetical protein